MVQREEGATDIERERRMKGRWREGEREMGGREKDSQKGGLKEEGGEREKKLRERQRQR